MAKWPSRHRNADDLPYSREGLRSTAGEICLKFRAMARDDELVVADITYSVLLRRSQRIVVGFMLKIETATIETFSQEFHFEL